MIGPDRIAASTVRAPTLTRSPLPSFRPARLAERPAMAPITIHTAPGMRDDRRSAFRRLSSHGYADQKNVIAADPVSAGTRNHPRNRPATSARRATRFTTA
jgi:hypothetical protein